MTSSTGGEPTTRFSVEPVRICSSEMQNHSTPFFPGSDYLDGEEGDDLLLGQGGNDELFGGEGNDELQGERATTISMVKKVPIRSRRDRRR